MDSFNVFDSGSYVGPSVRSLMATPAWNAERYPDAFEGPHEEDYFEEWTIEQARRNFRLAKAVSRLSTLRLGA